MFIQSNLVFIGLLCSVGGLLFFSIAMSLIFKKKIDGYKATINEQYANIEKLKKNNLNLSHSDIMSIIDSTIETVWKDKYLLYYRLKEIKVIANMDNEIVTITAEIMHSFSNPFMNTCLNYFTLDFITSMVTRKVQMLLIDYTNTYKPNTK
jgi:hypothetical protein